ncbi:MAG: TIGR03668 family PPOX class F420-dependent oxidoreductase [Chloroflexi bacterium]|nr:TIGR03668 family PPOX class F420-dependent oxidoreductase [Chloroflexota bacterium]
MDWKQAFLKDSRVARLATVDETGQAHVVPIVYVLDESHIYTPIDAKPKRVEAMQLRRVRNIQAEPRVCLVVDHYEEDWSRLVWVQVRGPAALIEPGEPQHAEAVSLLEAKYPQYGSMLLTNALVIAIGMETISGWRA